MLNDTKHGKSTPPIDLPCEKFQLNASDKTSNFAQKSFTTTINTYIMLN